MGKKVLVLYYSQSGQLASMVEAVTGPLSACEGVDVTVRAITPRKALPYPWPFYAFFDILPETVMLEGCGVEPLNLDETFDLIILAYTPWFLSPSLPISGFLNTPEAKKLLCGKPVITLIGCRDMWVMAQEAVKQKLEALEATLSDNVVLTDQGRALYTFVTTPRWMFTGRKTPFLFFPPAGILPAEVKALSRFGERLCDVFKAEAWQKEMPFFRGMGAVKVNGKLIATEKIARRSFKIWSRLIAASGDPKSLGRKAVITVYVVFLVAVILTVVPLNLLIKQLLYPFKKEQLAREAARYAEPSGE